MQQHSRRRARLGARALAALGLVVAGATGARAATGPTATASAGSIAGPDTLRADSAARVESQIRPVLDSLRGRSGKLRVAFVPSVRPLAVPVLERLFGAGRPLPPGLHRVGADSAGFTLIAMRPFSDKTAGRIGRYAIGSWPAEKRGFRRAGYENPEGFIEVTPENQDTRISEHFRLRDFLTKGQADVWPKYLVLREPLVDKLELVIAELEREGIDVRRMRVMSGFRTPSYNATGGSTAGRATLSRHMYGDAADVFVDNDGDDRMDDLNRDGRVDGRDAEVIRRAAERVERAHPELAGGVGVYKANRAHGPFAHIDVRGRVARWGGA